MPTAPSSSSSSAELRTKLLGAWTLVSLHVSRPSDPTRTNIPIFGAHPRGQVTYTPDGHMSALVVKGDAEPLSSLDNIFQLPVEERARAWLEATAYSGKFWVVSAEDAAAAAAAEGRQGKGEGEGQASSSSSYVLHKVEMSTTPNWVGTVQRRWVQWERDEKGTELMVLRPPLSTTGARGNEMVLKWKKAEENRDEMPAVEVME